MYRFVATMPAVSPLFPNALGTINRTLPPTMDKTLADGTPPTLPVVDAFLDPFVTINAVFRSMTYGPAIGFPFAIDKAKQYLGLSDGPQVNLLLHRGDAVASRLRERAFQSVLGQDVRVMTMSPEAFRGTPVSEWQTYLTQGGSILISLEAYLPRFKEVAGYAPMSLYAEIVGDAGVYEQMVISQGYVGPILEPVAQWLLSEAGPSVDFSSLEVPSVPELTTAFLDYFGRQTAHSFSDGVVVSGGCSGALVDILFQSESPKVVIGAPFFAPQEGLAQVANKSVHVCDRLSLTNVLSELSGADVLLTFPNNPDGDIPTPERMREWVSVANKQGHRLIIDNTYFNCVAEANKERYQALFGELVQSERYLVVASGSKALATTKYRTALVVGDSESVNAVRLHSTKPSVLSAVALFRALAPERRDVVRDMLVRHVRENTSLIQSLLEPTQQVDVSRLNSGLQKLASVLAEVGKEHVRFVPGDGALYGILHVADVAQKSFLDTAKQQNLALIPGAIFYGGRQDVAELLATPQQTYRLSLMADPGQRV